jgi:hypothetical protein
MARGFDEILREARKELESMRHSWLADAFSDARKDFEVHVESFKLLADELIDAAEGELNFIPGGSDETTNF